MSAPLPDGHIIALDVGKTSSKLSLWTQDGDVLERFERRNERLYSGGIICLDATGIEKWLAERLSDLTAHYLIAGIVPAAHGAAAALIRNGDLVRAPLDYETTFPHGIRERYGLKRDPFSVTGSPFLPNGLNLGMQLAWIEEFYPEDLANNVRIVPWPQYWTWVLSGVAVSEVTSWGCHTDLWAPRLGASSGMAIARGWDQLLAPLHAADDSFEMHHRWVSQAGLKSITRVFCGIHDSNAALHAVRSMKGAGGEPLTVLSTGTWFIAMRSLSAIEEVPALKVGLDCLINVDLNGRPVPSSRFMGGREIDLMLGAALTIDGTLDQTEMLASLSSVVEANIMALPSFVAGVGPFPDGKPAWVKKPNSTPALKTAVALYAALVADRILTLIGAHGRLVVEGRFARSQVFVRALTSLRAGSEVHVSDLADGVPLGALLLANPRLKSKWPLRAVEPLKVDLSSYVNRWRSEVAPL
jgi:sugar (pentulose or hexulose) kinase